ncbi:MAG: hypothetical protein K0S76_1373 [Herbinix sp.]|jgi:uncharacterized membrane protein|nr:hypothetical protein [Herbinix sp.]
MKTNKIIKLVTAALLASITCVATITIKINYGTGGGYIHPGDAFVLLSGIILGPLYGGISAGIGSMFADLFLGAPQYAAATFVLKLLTAVASGIIYRKIRFLPVVFAGIIGGIIVTSGYFIYERFLYGTFGAALVGVPFNIIQNLAALVMAFLLLPLLKKVPQIKAMMEK